MSPWESFFSSRISRKRSPIIMWDSVSCTVIKRALVVFQWAFQGVFLDLGGRPPLCFFRLDWSCLKYSGPRLAICFPPFRPSLTAAGSFFFGKIQRVQLYSPHGIMHEEQSSPNAI